MPIDMAEIVPLHVCGGCGGPGRPRDLQCVDDDSITTIHICDACHARHSKTLDRVRPVFCTMIDIGMPKPIASEVMTFLLARWPDP